MSLYYLDLTKSHYQECDMNFASQSKKIIQYQS